MLIVPPQSRMDVTHEAAPGPANGNGPSSGIGFCRFGSAVHTILSLNPRPSTRRGACVRLRLGRRSSTGGTLKGAGILSSLLEGLCSPSKRASPERQDVACGISALSQTEKSPNLSEPLVFLPQADILLTPAQCQKRSFASHEHRGIRPRHNSLLADQRGR
jgi:hypothetical protein